MQNENISVVIPHFRRLDVVREAIHSALEQTLLPGEIVVVDDASGTEDIHELCKISPIVRIVRLLNNQGVSFARNVGAATATGHWIAFLDSDDTWERGKLEAQFAHLQDNPGCIGVHTGCIANYPDGVTKQYCDKPSVLTTKELTQGSHLVVPSLLIRRDIFIESGGFDTDFRQTEDYEFSLRLAVANRQISFLPLPMTKIRYGRKDKLSLNWRGYITGHSRVVWRYRKNFREAMGAFATQRKIASYIVKGGKKRGGLGGRVVQLVGYISYPPLMWGKL